MVSCLARMLKAKVKLPYLPTIVKSEVRPIIEASSFSIDLPILFSSSTLLSLPHGLTIPLRSLASASEANSWRSRLGRVTDKRGGGSVLVLDDVEFTNGSTSTW